MMSTPSSSTRVVYSHGARSITLRRQELPNPSENLGGLRSILRRSGSDPSFGSDSGSER